VRRAGSGRKDPTRPRLCNPYTVVGTEEVGASTQVMQENQSCSNNRLLFLFNLHPVVISALVITDSFAPNLDSLAVSLFFLSLTLPVPASASQSVAADRALILHRVRLGPGPQGPERNSTTLPFLAPIQPFSCTKNYCIHDIILFPPTTRFPPHTLLVRLFPHPHPDSATFGSVAQRRLPRP